MVKSLDEIFSEPAATTSVVNPRRTLDEIFSQPSQEPVEKILERFPVQRSAAGEIGTAALRGITAGIPEAAGKATQNIGRRLDMPSIVDVGASMEEFGTEMGKRPYLRPSADLADRPVVRTLSGVAESLPLTIVPVAAGAIGTAVGGPIAGGAAAVSTAFPLFGGSSAEETRRKVIEAGGTEAEADSAATKTFAIQGAGDSALTLLGGRLLGAFGKSISRSGAKTAKDVLLSVANPRHLRTYGKELAKVMVAEAATEAGQDIGQQLVEEGAGVKPEQTILETGTSSAVGGALMAAFFGALGIPANAAFAKRQTRLLNALADPNVNSSNRAAAAQAVADQIETVDPEKAKNWQDNTMLAIALKKPITFTDSFIAPFSAERWREAPIPEGQPGAEIGARMEERATPSILDGFGYNRKRREEQAAADAFADETGRAIPEPIPPAPTTARDLDITAISKKYGWTPTVKRLEDIVRRRDELRSSPVGAELLRLDYSMKEAQDAREKELADLDVEVNSILGQLDSFGKKKEEVDTPQEVPTNAITVDTENKPVLSEEQKSWLGSLLSAVSSSESRRFKNARVGTGEEGSWTGTGFGWIRNLPEFKYLGSGFSFRKMSDTALIEKAIAGKPLTKGQTARLDEFMEAYKTLDEEERMHGKGKQEVRMETLPVGTEMTIDGEKFAVKDIDFGEGFDPVITLKDGKEYKLRPGDTMFVDPGSVREGKGAESLRSDAGQVRQGSAEGQPSVQPGAVEGGGDLQLDAEEKQKSSIDTGQAEIDVNLIPDDMEVRVTVIREKNGGKYQVKENARSAMADNMAAMDTYRAIMECLRI